MKKIDYPFFNESLFQTDLENGLKVNLLPKRGFHKTYGILSVDFGSNDTSFIPKNKKDFKVFPAGSAHFLEHKLFEKEDYDAFDLFSHFGADLNAFTSYTKTSFLFSTTANVKDNLNTLLDFVQRPYFSERSVEKEKQIIAQEIKMYDDDVDWQLYSGIVRNLYPHLPLSYDIAGSVASVNKITVADLYENYGTFYQPSNMNLFVAGAIDAAETLDWIKENQDRKYFEPAFVVQRANLKDLSAKEKVISYRQNYFVTSRPKVALGMRGLDPLPKGRAGLKYELALQLFFYLLLGESSSDYQQLYNTGIIDDSFDYGIEVERGFHFASFSGDTDKPQEFKEKIAGLIMSAVTKIAGRENEFRLAKREFIGRQFRAMNTLELIADQYEGKLFDNATLFDKAGLMQQLNFEDVLDAGRHFVSEEGFSVYELFPKEEV
ncbi:EF-P 5-aminopentanol modification-associated protein YfmH [Liquorilactobacillus oeni]|uniref:Peptidase n=1 Tax=Liquorilactobacillus oeni DSM 19972 TaxID=1423777 RepID=A0A0R1M9H4_9LACO|nr:pitrilysin family protein [Liquorilactobacillus oeni]KRL04782.1 peptidase [Liquorilactobacillus oeni DSM 19972]